jgi:hypothetical protein
MSHIRISGRGSTNRKAVIDRHGELEDGSALLASGCSLCE